MGSTPFERTDPAAYTHWVDDVIRFSDQDPGGHVNNVAYAAYVEHGRVSIMRETLADRPADLRFVLAHLEIDYLAEAQFPGRLRIGTRLERIGASSVTFAAAVFQDGRCLATAKSVVVCKAGARSAPLPPDLRAVLAALDAR